MKGHMFWKAEAWSIEVGTDLLWEEKNILYFKRNRQEKRVGRVVDLTEDIKLSPDDSDFLF